MTPKWTTQTEQRLSDALRDLLMATEGVGTQYVQRARRAAHDVYIETLAPGIKDDTVRAAQVVWDNAPVESFLADTNRCSNFDDAMALFGTSLLDRVMVLGPEAAGKEFSDGTAGYQSPGRRASPANGTTRPG